MVKLSTVVKSHLEDMLEFDSPNMASISFIRLIVSHHPNLNDRVTDEYLEWLFDQAINNKLGEPYDANKEY